MKGQRLNGARLTSAVREAGAVRLRSGLGLASGWQPYTPNKWSEMKRESERAIRLQLGCLGRCKGHWEALCRSERESWLPKENWAEVKVK